MGCNTKANNFGLPAGVKLAYSSSRRTVEKCRISLSRSRSCKCAYVWLNAIGGAYNLFVCICAKVSRQI